MQMIITKTFNLYNKCCKAVTTVPSWVGSHLQFFQKILIPSHFVPPPPIMEVLVDPPPNEKKSYFHPSETFKLLLLECQCGLTIVRRNTH